MLGYWWQKAKRRRNECEPEKMQRQGCSGPELSGGFLNKLETAGCCLLLLCSGKQDLVHAFCKQTQLPQEYTWFEPLIAHPDENTPVRPWILANCFDQGAPWGIINTAVFDFQDVTLIIIYYSVLQWNTGKGRSIMSKVGDVSSTCKTYYYAA